MLLSTFSSVRSQTGSKTSPISARWLAETSFTIASVLSLPTGTFVAALSFESFDCEVTSNLSALSETHSAGAFSFESTVTVPITAVLTDGLVLVERVAPRRF